MSLSFNDNGFQYSDDGGESSQQIEPSINFVKTSDEMSDLMKTTYESLCKTVHPSTIRIISDDECVNFPKAEMRQEKMIIFVFDDFDDKNPAFSYISAVESVYIFGSRFLQSMMRENAQALKTIRQIHNISMRGCVVATSAIAKDKKQHTKRLVTWMNGRYTNALLEVSTHLVCEGVSSVKYDEAAKRGMKVMHTDWIDRLWKASSISTELKVDLEKFNNFKLPIFFNLIITSTGLSLKERDEVKTLVEENGGKYNVNFNSKIHILVMPKESIGSEKHKAAVKIKKTCLYKEWIHESIRFGYAASIDEYTVKTDSLKSSTPTKKTVNSTVSNFNPDCTRLSEISHIPSMDTDVSICETLASMSVRQTRSSSRFEQNKSHEPGFSASKLNITLKDAKKLGPLLDGFHMYLDGFTKGAQTELNKILTALGALKFNDIEESTTHVIVGDMSAELFNMIKQSTAQPLVVKVDWLQQIIAKKKLIGEKEFEVKNTSSTKSKQQPEPPSPSSKKIMSSLSNNFKKPAPKNLFQEPEPNDDLIEQYLDIQMPPAMEDTVDDGSAAGMSKTHTLLQGKNVFLYGFQEGELRDVIESCESCGGNLVDSSYKYEVDFIITPVSIEDFNFPVKYKHLVSVNWLFTSENEGKLMDLDLWYKPFLSLKKPILDKEKFVVTNYRGDSRVFVKNLVNCCGGEAWEQICPSKNPDYILVTDSTIGEKFKYTKKNNFTALTAEWLYECNVKQMRVDETPYLIGGTSASKNNLKSVENRRESVVPSSQACNSFDFYDPPVENIDEPLLTPTRTTSMAAPRTNFNSAYKRLIADMPTPIRNEAAKVLNMRSEKKSPNSPRRRALQNTGGQQRTPMSERPSFSLRPDETPNTVEHHKRRMEAMDKFFNEPTEKRPRVDPNSDLMELSPPYRQKRYDFYKSQLDDYDSPDPRKESLPPSHAATAGTRLNFETDQNEGTDFFALPPPKKMPEPLGAKRKLLPDSDDIQTEPPNSMYMASDDTDNLVTWDSGSQSLCRPRRPQKKYIFAFSFVKDELRGSLEEIVRTLGGEITTNNNFTHLITPSTTKGEKYLTGIAMGAFILHQKYLYKCKEERRFVDESEFEFGNPDSARNNSSQKIDNQVADAGYRWRKWISSNRNRFSKGAFTSFKFVMMNKSTERSQQLSQVLKYGGAEMLDVDPKCASTDELMRSNLQYCFTDLKKPLNTEFKKKLEDAGVKILSFNSIFHYLVSKELPNEIQ